MRVSRTPFGAWRCGGDRGRGPAAPHRVRAAFGADRGKGRALPGHGLPALPARPSWLDRKPSSVAALTPQAAALLSSILGHTVEHQRSAPHAELKVTTPESLAPRKPGVYIAPDESISDVERALTELRAVTRPADSRAAARGEDPGKAPARSTGACAESIPVSVFVDSGFFTTVSTHSLLGNLIQEAGGKNIARAGAAAGAILRAQAAAGEP